MNRLFLTLALSTGLTIGAPQAKQLPEELMSDAFLEFDFSADKADVNQIDKKISYELDVGDFGKPLDKPLDCVRKGVSNSHAKYFCAATEKVLGVMGKVYQKFTIPVDPVTYNVLNDVSLQIATVATTSCSLSGCTNSVHPGAQPCLYGYDSMRRLICWHSPYTVAHKCN
jgi:hypothetical protein